MSEIRAEIRTVRGDYTLIRRGNRLTISHGDGGSPTLDQARRMAAHRSSTILPDGGQIVRVGKIGEYASYFLVTGEEFPELAFTRTGEALDHVEIVLGERRIVVHAEELHKMLSKIGFGLAGVTAL